MKIFRVGDKDAVGSMASSEPAHMMEKTISRYLVLTLAASFALLTSCSQHTSVGDPSSHSPMPVGSNENPQTVMKKQSGGT